VTGVVVPNRVGKFQSLMYRSNQAELLKIYMCRSFKNKQEMRQIQAVKLASGIRQKKGYNPWKGLFKEDENR